MQTASVILGCEKYLVKNMADFIRRSGESDWHSFCGFFSDGCNTKRKPIMRPKIKAKPWVNIALFESRGDGEILAAFLNKHRIEARVYNDRLLQILLFLCSPRATFRVQVRANASRAATELLGGAPEATAMLQRAIHCPSCDSLRVEYPQMTRKFFLPTVLLHLGIIFRVIQHEAYCESCHRIWNLPHPEKQGLPRLKVSGH